LEVRQVADLVVEASEEVLAAEDSLAVVLAEVGKLKYN
jgi:hypothetical protein